MMLAATKERILDDHNTADIVKFSEKEPFNFGMLFVWLAAIIAITSTAFMWINNTNVASDLSTKLTEKDNLIKEITSPTYIEVEKNVSGFRSSVEVLSQAQKNRFPMSQFLPEFYKHLTKDVQINNLALNDQNQISFDGTTGTYRSAADLVVALSAWEPMKAVTLNTVSSTIDDAGKQKVTFAISATIDKTKDFKVKAVSTGATALDSTQDATGASAASTDSISSSDSVSSTADSTSDSVSSAADSISSSGEDL